MFDFSIAASRIARRAEKEGRRGAFGESLPAAPSEIP